MSATLEQTSLGDDELAARIRQAEAANRAKDDFLAVLSHELRTPTSAILLWARLLMSGAVKGADQVEALRAIVRSAEVQNQLVEDLVDMARLSKGALHLERRLVEMAETVGSTVDGLRAVADEKGVSLAFEGHAPTKVSADPRRLQQIVANLVSNAVKFTPAGGRVDVTLSATSLHARLVVRDTGCGIAPERLTHIFDPFRLAEASTTRRHGGMGLGLAIVHQLVCLHGGTLAAESAGEGTGATFIVELPLGSDGPRAERRRGLRDEGWRPLAGVRVLLVEDHAETRRALCFALEAGGAEVVSAASAAQAFEAATLAAPDVIVSDVCMPSEDGFSLLRRLRAHAAEHRRRAPVALALTAHTSQLREQALASGFGAHAAKPIDPEQLVRLVAALHGQRAAGPPEEIDA
ncbi:MAG TPA: ATP-binding protein [Polyangia bacterium]|nr:ATP-binding protein [Polyangia bacterium]